jgi:hypothetical protein
MYIVWMPTLRPDNKIEAVLRSGEYADNRLTYYWDEGLHTGTAWQELFDLNGVAWDVYFVYGPDQMWDDKPSSPNFYMHQLGSLPRDLRLDGDALKSDILTRLQH